jgi:uncharacterized protein YdhG (YjbR/CyaY superfamily)
MRTPVRPAALVAAYFDNLAPEERETALALRDAVLAAAPQLTQAVKWGNLTFQLGGQSIISIVLHKSHAHLQFFNGAELAVQYTALEGTGKGMRHLKCRYRQPIDAEVVRDLVAASVDAAS